MNRIFHIAAFGLLTACIISCGEKKEAEKAVKTLKLDTVRYFGTETKAEFPGKVQASGDVNLAFRVSGTILDIPVKEGQAVKKGDLIAQIDPRDYKTQLEATRAEYLRIKGEADRIAALYKEKSVAQNDYEKALYGMQQITAKLEAAENALKDTGLRAPFDGYIQKLLFDINETVAAGMPVISMINNALPEVEINIPLSEYVRREQMSEFTCRFDILPGKEFPLSLIGINRKANLNQLYKMRLQMKSDEDAHMLSPGMVTMVTIGYASAATALREIPLSAVVHENGKTFVWTYDPSAGHAETAEIKIESIRHNGTAVISSGPEAGTLIVTAGAHSLREGDKVKAMPAKSSTNIGGML